MVPRQLVSPPPRQTTHPAAPRGYLLPGYCLRDVGRG